MDYAGDGYSVPCPSAAGEIRPILDRIIQVHSIYSKGNLPQDQQFPTADAFMTFRITSEGQLQTYSVASARGSDDADRLLLVMMCSARPMSSGCPKK